MKLVKSLIFVTTIALQTVACASLGNQGIDAKADLNITEGSYKVTERNANFCDDMTIEWQGQGKDLMLALGAQIMFLDVNQGIVTDKQSYYEDGCYFETETKTAAGVLIQEQREICNGYSTSGKAQVTVEGSIIKYDLIRTTTNATKRPAMNVSCTFKLQK